MRRRFPYLVLLVRQHTKLISDNCIQTFLDVVQLDKTAVVCPFATSFNRTFQFKFADNTVHVVKMTAIGFN